MKFNFDGGKETTFTFMSMLNAIRRSLYVRQSLSIVVSLKKKYFIEFGKEFYIVTTVRSFRTR